MSATGSQGRDSDRGADRGRTRDRAPRRRGQGDGPGPRAPCRRRHGSRPWSCATRRAARSRRSSCGPARSRSSAVPRANGAYRDGRFELYSRVNIGLVVADEHSYLIPTVFDADRKSLTELTDEIERVTASRPRGRARAARLRRSDVHPVLRRRARRPRLDDRRQLAAGRRARGGGGPPGPGGARRRRCTSGHLMIDHARLRSPDPLRGPGRTLPDGGHGRDRRHGHVDRRRKAGTISVTWAQPKQRPSPSGCGRPWETSECSARSPRRLVSGSFRPASERGRTRTSRCRSPAARRSRSRWWSPGCSRRCSCGPTTGCSTSAPGRVITRRCWRGSPGTCGRSSATRS